MKPLFIKIKKMEELSETRQIPDSGQVLPEMAVKILQSTAAWMRFVSIAGFLGFAFSVVRLIGIFSNDHAMTAPGSNSGLNEYRLMVTLIGIVAFFPSLFLFSYASKISTFCESDDYNALESGLRMQKRFWKFVALALIVVVIVVPISLLLLMSQI